MMILIGRFYTTGSLAALPAALVVVGMMLAMFREHGPQSQGLGALAIGAAGVLAVLGVNALIAGILAYTVPSVRPSWTAFGITTVSMAAGVGLFFLLLSRT